MYVYGRGIAFIVVMGFEFNGCTVQYGPFVQFLWFRGLLRWVQFGANSRIIGIVLIHDNPGDAINVRTKWRQLRSVVQRYGYGIFKFPGVITFGNDKNNDLGKVELFNRDGLCAQ